MAGHSASSSVAFWNFLELKKKFLDPWLVESMGSEPAGTEDWLYSEMLGFIIIAGGFPGGFLVKNLLAMQELQETQVGSMGWEDPLE